MSQFGMQMPGGRRARAATPNVYTALMFIAVVALAAGCAVLWINGSKIAPDGNPLSVQSEGDISLPR